MILNNYYWYFTSVLSKEVCDKIVELGLSKPTQKGVVGVNKDKFNVSKKTRDSDVTWLNDKWVYNYLQPFVQTANKNAGWNFDWDFSESCQFTIYNKNQHYDWHADMKPEPYPENFDNINYRNKIRKLSMTVSLTDKEEYVGGDLEFDFRDTKDSKKNIKVCKEIWPRGSIVVFPSFVWHKVKPVTKGTRYSLVMWSIGAPFK
jgi:PKHD-type hydroxylase